MNRRNFFKRVAAAVAAVGVGGAAASKGAEASDLSIWDKPFHLWDEHDEAKAAAFMRADMDEFEEVDSVRVKFDTWKEVDFQLTDEELALLVPGKWPEDGGWALADTNHLSDVSYIYTNRLRGRWAQDEKTCILHEPNGPRILRITKNSV